MNKSSKRVVVVGGGVVGATCAHELSRTGWDVTVLDRGRFGEGAAIGNCGLISPSHILPLAEPGVISKVISAMIRPDSPFSIRPGWDLSLWSWLVHFARRCNTRDMLEAAEGIDALLRSSMERFEALRASEPLDCEWENAGLLIVYQDREGFEAFAATNQLLTDEFRFPARRLAAAALAMFEPALKPGAAGGWFYEQDSHLRTDRLLASWRRILEARGVAIREQCAAIGFEGRDDLADAVVTNQNETIPADAVVVAAGALTPLLEGPLGAPVPIQPGKGYSLTMPRPALCPRRPILFPEKRVFVTPFQSGYRIGSTMQFAGYDDTLDRRRLQLLKDGAAAFLKEPYCEPIEQEWYGWRPMTYDSLPIIDFSPRFSNVLIAAGHNMLGLTMAPGTARLAAELLNGEPPHIDPTPYRLTRFSE